MTTLSATMNFNYTNVPRFYVRDSVNALTHFIGFGVSICAMPGLLIHAAYRGANTVSLISLGIFMLSMIFLYAASTAYHAFNLTARANRILKKLDHMMIFILIAGSYTPICLIALPSSIGIRLLIAVWSIAALGLILKAFWVTCPRWFSSVIYISMGWVCLMAFSDIISSLSTASFIWLVAGGVSYTIGGVVYALKLSFLRKWFRSFGAHEIFHLFVMLGSVCHYIVMYSLV